MDIFNQDDLTVITTLYYRDKNDELITSHRDDNINIYYNRHIDSVIINNNKRKTIIPMHRVLAYEVS